MDTLAQKRVDFIYKLVKDKIKIREDFKTRSFGKLHQQDTEKSKNRRVVAWRASTLLQNQKRQNWPPIGVPSN